MGIGTGSIANLARVIKAAYERDYREMSSPAYHGIHDHPQEAPRVAGDRKADEHVWKTIGMIGSQSYLCVACDFQYSVFDSPDVSIPDKCKNTNAVPNDIYWHSWSREWRVSGS